MATTHSRRIRTDGSTRALGRLMSALLLLVSVAALSVVGCANEAQEKGDGVKANAESKKGSASGGAESASADSELSLALIEGEHLKRYSSQTLTPNARPAVSRMDDKSANFERSRSKAGYMPPTEDPAMEPSDSRAELRDSNKAEQADEKAGDDAPDAVEAETEEQKQAREAIEQAQAAARRIMAAEQGELWARPVVRDGQLIQPGMAFPLESTDVRAQISGFIAQTSVTQTFSNPMEKAIEAVYIFPLPEDSAVNGYIMTIGERKITGLIRKRAEAKAIYEDAKRRGYRAALLEQERENIFTQNIANIAPGEQISVELSFMNRLKREGGTYKWHFPMVVGPRFTGNAPDPERITPPTVPEGMRTGNDISLSVEVDAGLDITDMRVLSHDFRQVAHSPSHYTVELAPHETIPNKDFVLEFDVFGSELKTGYAAHADGEEGFVALMIAPPQNPAPSVISPREVVFLIDVSGSMRGTPLKIAKDLVDKTIHGLRPTDSFNIMTYSGSTKRLWQSSGLATSENKQDAREFVRNLSGGGGTQMQIAVQEMLSLPRDGERMRMVAFFTDGYVGDESQVLSTIKQRKDDSTRIFAFGTGNSVNRSILEEIGKHGQGHTEILLSNQFHQSDRAVQRFFDHMATPVFTHITAEWKGVGEVETYPENIRDVFAGIPVSLVGRYDASNGPLSGSVVLRGYLGGQMHEMEIGVDLPAQAPGNVGLSAVWAREKIEALTDARLGTQGNDRDQLNEMITQTALKYRIVSENTSFVAVDSEGGAVSDGNPDRVDQPVEQPDGVDREGTGRDGGGPPAPGIRE